MSTDDAETRVAVLVSVGFGGHGPLPIFQAQLSDDLFGTRG